jgi:hypothetical protein
MRLGINPQADLERSLNLEAGREYQSIKHILLKIIFD